MGSKIIEIFNKIASSGTTYYEYYAITLKDEEKYYVATKTEAEDAIKTLKDNTITFVDFKGNEIISEIKDNSMLFKFDDKKSTIVNLPQDDSSERIKAVDVVKEKRDNGCIIEVKNIMISQKTQKMKRFWLI